jgi:hypothetical protein
LKEDNFFNRNLHTQIPSSNHNTIRTMDNLI